MKTRAERINKIVETAFDVWGNEYYSTSSLGALAAAIGVTKPALYRYFPSKEALLGEMEERFYRSFGELFERAADKAEKSDGKLSTLFRIYNRTVIRYFGENPSFYRFFIYYILTRPGWESRMEMDIAERNADFLSDGIIADKTGFTGQAVDTASRFLNSNGFFILGWTDPAMLPPGVDNPFDGKDIDYLLDLNERLVLSGAAADRDGAPVDYDALDEVCVLSPDDILPPDRIFSAVAEVVAEEGLWKASVDKIAKRLGMSKSSLYFHFENRDDMMARMMDRELDQIWKLLGNRFHHATGFEESLYLFFRVVTNYLMGKPAFLTVVNWLRFQRIDVKVDNPRAAEERQILQFLKKASGDKKLVLLEKSPIVTAFWINFLLIHEIMTCSLKGIRDEGISLRLRTLHELILYGLERR